MKEYGSRNSDFNSNIFYFPYWCWGLPLEPSHRKVRSRVTPSIVWIFWGVMEGWIKLHRKILDWSWYTDVNTKTLFLHLLLSANHKDAQWKQIYLKPGQLVTTIFALSKQLKISTQSIRTSISRLKSTNEITSTSTNKYTVITVCNYDRYQNKEVRNNKQNNNQSNKRVTNKQQTKPAYNVLQECKEGKEEVIEANKEVIEDRVKVKDIYCSNGTFEKFWTAYPRKKSKGSAETAWKKLKMTPAFLETLLSAITQAKKSADWQKDGGKFIPYPASWLNAKGWEDEYEPANAISRRI